jgi:hypothetical protein
LDDSIIEVDWNGNILWRWRAHEHFEELGFDSTARDVLRRNPNLIPRGGVAIGDVAAHPGGCGDWLRVNSVSLLGPNR